MEALLVLKQKKQSLHKITLFICYTFLITWLCWFLIILCNKYFDALWYGTPLFWIIYTTGGLAPAIIGYVIYRQFPENTSKSPFLKFIFNKKISGKMWVVFLLFSVWRFFMIWISFGIHQPISILAMLINLPLLILLGGLEELGWRGVLQPPLEKTTTYLASILLVGTIWSIWHLPLWLIEGTVQSVFPFGLYWVSGIVLSTS